MGKKPDEALDSMGIPKSHSWRIYFCGHCPNAHLIFTDCNGKKIAHAIFTAAQARNIAKRIEAIDPNFRTAEDK